MINFDRLLAIILGLTCSGAAASPSPVRIPFKFEDSRIYVPVTSGKSVAGWFILDSGASPTILDRRFADSLHLSARNLQSVQGAGAGSTQQGEIGKVQLSVGAVPLIVGQAVSADLSSLLGPTSGRNPSGIIGSQLFREHVVEIDFRSRELRVWPEGTDLENLYAHLVPLVFNDWTPLTDAVLTLPSGKPLKEHVLVDLGAKSTLLIPEPFIARHRLGDAFERGVTLPLGAGVGGNTFYRFARARRVAIGGRADLAIENPVVGLSTNGTLRSDWHEGLLGADYLSRFAIAFDYGRARMLISRFSDHAEPLDRSGLFIVWHADPKRYTVRDVLTGGPGKKAGLKVGDELISVGGRRTSGLTLSEIRGLLKSTANEISLIVRRSNRDLPVTLHLADLI